MVLLSIAIDASATRPARTVHYGSQPSLDHQCSRQISAGPQVSETSYSHAVPFFTTIYLSCTPCGQSSVTHHSRSLYSASSVFPIWQLFIAFSSVLHLPKRHRGFHHNEQPHRQNPWWPQNPRCLHHRQQPGDENPIGVRGCAPT